MAKLASLVVDLQLQSAQLRQGLDEANRKLDAFAKQAESAGSIIAGAISFDFLRDNLTALANFIRGGADATVAMSNMAKAAGTPVEEFSKLAYAAERFGFESDNLAESFGQLAEYMAEAKGGSAEHVALFKALGISVTDARGNLRSTGDVFRDLAQRFSETQDGAAKTALAVKFFGEEGIKLIPTLNLGRDGLAKFGEEAARTGRVVTADGVAGTERFSKAIKMLEGAAQGLAANVARDLAPSMAALAEGLATSKGGADAFANAAQYLATLMRGLASAGVIVGASFETLGQLLAGVASALVNIVQGDFQAARESLQAEGEALLTTWKEEGKRLNAIWTTSGPGAAMATDAEKAKPSADAYVSAIERTKKAAEKAAESQKKLAEASRKAAEESAKALDEHVKAALALERQHAAIDRAAEKLRAEASPTEGFADLEDALSRMAAAQKAAATLRSRASERERGGDILGADSATRKADELAALAERASSAVDAFRTMGREAEEAAARLLEEQVAAAAALERTFDDIDREVAARRGAGAAGDPTAGFSSFHAALDAMAEALKREASLRAEASALERAGKLGEARQALLAAEATKALAEQSSLAADALQAMDSAAARAPQELAGMLAPSGAAVSAALKGAQTGAAAGPVGAVAGGVVGLLSQSESFQNALGELERIFQTLADSVGLLVEPLMPLLVVVSEVAAGLGALFEALSPVVEFVARPLFEVFRGFGVVVLGLVKFIGDIINGLGQLFGFENSLDMSGIGKAMERLENASYDSAREQQKVANAARATTESIANVPSWWSVEMARFNAAEPGRPGAGGGSNVVNDNSETNIEIKGDDPVEIADRVIDELEKRKDRIIGNRGKEDW